jgi:hypothetical protein
MFSNRGRTDCMNILKSVQKEVQRTEFRSPDAAQDSYG